MREGESHNSGCLFFQDEQIIWRQIKRSAVSRYPEGKLINILFGIGREGERNWKEKNGRIKEKRIREIFAKKRIMDLDSYFWEICEEIGCRHCDHFVSLEDQGKKLCNLHCDHREWDHMNGGNDCRDCRGVDLCRRDNPLNETLKIFRHSLTNASPAIRRTMVLLALFYHLGEPEGGYNQTDIGRMAGLDRYRGVEKAKKLNEMGIIRKVSKLKPPRYTFDPFPNEDMRGIEKSHAEFVRNRSKEVISDLNKQLKKGRQFVENKNFIALEEDIFDITGFVPRVIIGKVLPPDCIVETIHSFEKLYHNLNLELIIPIAFAGKASEITKDQLMGRMEEFASGLVKIYDSMSAEDVRRLSEYITKRSRSRGRNESRTTLLYTF